MSESAEIKVLSADAESEKKLPKPKKSSVNDMFATETVRYCGFCGKIFIGEEAHSKHLAEFHPGIFKFIVCLKTSFGLFLNAVTQVGGEGMCTFVTLYEELSKTLI